MNDFANHLIYLTGAATISLLLLMGLVHFCAFAYKQTVRAIEEALRDASRRGVLEP